MFENQQQKRIFFWTIELLAVASLIFVLDQVSFLFQPISVFASTIFMPVMIAGFLYYLLNPLVEMLTKIKIKGHYIPRIISVLLIFLGFFALLIVVLSFLLPAVIGQLSNLIESAPKLVNSMKQMLTDVSQQPWLKSLDLQGELQNLKGSLDQYLSAFVTGTASSILSVITVMTSITLNAITIPVILFYMLSDGNKLVPAIQKFTPAKQDRYVAELAGKMNNTIERYITGQAIEMIFVAVAISTGYLIIGQPYALLLGLFAGVTNLIPYVGPWIGLIPSVIVALTVDMKQLLYVIIVVVIIQQIDGNLIYPNVIGKNLKMHPLTIILLLLTAGSLFGIIGIIIAVPFYAVARTILQFIWDLRRVSQTSN